ncbi:MULTISPECIES: WXG100 family type VII secretion target [Streptomycetaceae]|uniref:Uncharacterized protein n=1 Tax=Streptantibioticus cattleyicolor (strain ATCC 35852 / DSM 46488 / JCM 4925 / NBRC 14057 / NRRL 8057) TaxID=1003195 RepID=F8JY87_STREN|nr:MULTISPECIES: WXG100 family type VII secretion target [Streptomycetaceae]AEW94675.1 hypothetical protein SCATT_23040 [Streptantibioticus cattleyicolor NRRL 8057 = DSM 46488]MYS59308.1 WXG100 family type VII secretion target [Streptomyces sp. SID5468]CCB75029.1 protein of unknown function [Streptantibioticus cattleyicolor NRRL 8057 = DSM 46488]
MSGNTITLEELRIDLAQLRDAITIVGARAASIRNNVNLINMTFNEAESVWHSPAAHSFAQLQAEFTTIMGDLDNLLDEMTHRMKASHQQYLDMEETNTRNIGDNEHNTGNHTGGHHRGRR